MRLELTRVGLLVELANHYTTMLCFSTKTKKIHKKNRKAFGKIDPQQCAKYLEATLLFLDFSKAFNSIQGEQGANTTSIWSPQRNCYSYNNALKKS